eukprot:1009826-Prymnesium_polylepis.1
MRCDTPLRAAARTTAAAAAEVQARSPCARCGCRPCRSPSGSLAAAVLCARPPHKPIRVAPPPTR